MDDFLYYFGYRYQKLRNAWGSGKSVARLERIHEKEVLDTKRRMRKTRHAANAAG